MSTKIADRFQAMLDHPARVHVVNTAYTTQHYHRTAWQLETNIGTECIGTDVADLDPDMLPDDADECNEIMLEAFGDYIEGNEITSGERMEHWVTNWTMPGYLDRGMEHTAESEAESLAAFLEHDGESDSWETDQANMWLPDNVIPVLSRLAELADEGDAIAITTLQHHLPELLAE